MRSICPPAEFGCAGDAWRSLRFTAKYTSSGFAKLLQASFDKKLVSVQSRNPQYLEELHLSHNLLTEIGAVSLISAGQRHRTPGQEPLWLRLERNHIQNPKKAQLKILKWRLNKWIPGLLDLKVFSNKLTPNDL